MAIILNNMLEPPDLAAPATPPPPDVIVSRAAVTSSAAPTGEPPVPAGSPATVARETKQTTTTTRDGGAARPVTGRVRCSFKLDSVDVRLYSSPAAAAPRDSRPSGAVMIWLAARVRRQGAQCVRFVRSCRLFGAAAAAAVAAIATTEKDACSSLQLSPLTPDAAARDDRHALAHFQLLDTGFDLCLQTDASLQACVVVNDCILDDERPASQGGITRYEQPSVVEHQATDR